MAKKRDQITINPKGGLRFRVEAALGDLTELRGMTFTTALTWLAGYALDMLYRGRRMTIPWLIAEKLKDKRFEWGLLEGEPAAAKALLAERADIDIEALRLIASGQATPTEENLSGLASAFDMEVDLLIDIAEGRGPFINGEASVHAERH